MISNFKKMMALDSPELKTSDLSSLNIQNGINTVLFQFEATGKQLLTYVQVAYPGYADSDCSDDVDTDVIFSLDCSGSVSTGSVIGLLSSEYHRKMDCQRVNKPERNKILQNVIVM